MATLRSRFRWGLEALGITNGPASVSVWSKKLEAGNGAAPVRVRVSDRARLQSLIRYLREAGCIAEQASEDTLDVFMPALPTQREARMELRYLPDGLAGTESRRRDQAPAASPTPGSRLVRPSRV